MPAIFILKMTNDNLLKLIIIRNKFLENYSFLIDQLSLCVCEKCIVEPVSVYSSVCFSFATADRVLSAKKQWRRCMYVNNTYLE